jgi:hypothetical protein
VHSDASWRQTWTHIIPGRFSSSPYTGLLFYEASTGYAEVYETDGAGAIVAPALHAYPQLGSRSSWTHIVPGLFGTSGLTGLLLYDQAAGFGSFYECTANGFEWRSEYTDWRTTWSVIVSGLFTTSQTSGLLFYSPSECYAELWDTDGVGLAGFAPVHSYPVGGQWTHIVAADFWWTPGPIASTPIYSDLCFYNAADGSAEVWNMLGGGNVAVVASGTVMAGAANVIAGNFGGPFGNADVMLHDRATGRLDVYSVGNPGIVHQETIPDQTSPGLRTTIDLVVPGNFYMANHDDHWFNDGPATVLPYDRNWRAGLGAFTDVLLYDRAAGLGETYLHEPFPPPAAALDAYVTSQSSHLGGSPVASGSVLPGERIDVHVSSTATYAVDIYRQGYFVGEPEQLIIHLGTFDATGALPIDRNGYKDGAGWGTTASLVIPTSYPSGLYLARISTLQETVDVPFVVRATSDSRARILLVIADTTYTAYNDWGGRNVYGFTMLDGGERGFAGMFPNSSLRGPYAFEVSFERPLAFTLGNSTQKNEIPMVRWLMKSGVPVDVCTARDLHFEPPDTGTYRLLLFAGHHEYWTSKMRDHVETFTQAGGNVGFFCGNTCWWQIRITTDGTKLYCYKNAGFDLAAPSAELTTVNWWDTPVLRPETTLTGVSWLNGSVIGDDVPGAHFTVTNPNHWAFQYTGLASGSTFGAFAGGNVVGSETDPAQTGEHGLITPANYGCANAIDPATNQAIGTMGSCFFGAGEVFNTATINWARGLADNSPSNPIPRITMNAIDRLGPKFRKISGFATDIGVGANDAVWIVTTTSVNGGFSIQQWVGSGWSTISGGALRIAVDPRGNPWVVNSVNSIFQLVDGWWQVMPGSGTDVGIGADGTVWMIGTGSGDRPIFRWNGSSWTQMPGGAVRIAVGPTGNAWVVNSAGSIYEWTGSTWQNRPGLAVDVGVGQDGTVWVVGVTPANGGGGNGIFRWTGDDWREVVGAGAQISVGFGDVPWAVSGTHEIYAWG